MLGGDYPGFLCQRVERTDPSTLILRDRLCGKHSPMFKGENNEFNTPSLEELETASRRIADEVMQSRQDATPVNAEGCVLQAISSSTLC